MLRVEEWNRAVSLRGVRACGGEANRRKESVFPLLRRRGEALKVELPQEAGGSLYVGTL